MARSLVWLRRDLRLTDHPALDVAAAAGPDGVVALVVLDDTLLGPAAGARAAFYLRSVRALDEQLQALGTRLLVRHGRPEQVVPAVVAETGSASVHISADFAPYGMARDERAAEALGTVPLVTTGSPYAVAPGRVRTKAGGPFQVFGPFYRAWAEHGWRAPAPTDPAHVPWATPPEGVDLPPDPASVAGMTLPPAGERAALETWAHFRDHLDEYAETRDRVDLDGSSRLSPYLKVGSIHPRTLLAELGPEHDVFRRELAWREFYAAVLHAWPASAREYFKPDLAALPYVTGRLLEERLTAWQRGRTGFPLVDAAMRHLLVEGWMPNRLRMLTASFLVKDLQVEWQHGARHFLHHLIDGDLASNQHNWQWVAGSGTDAAPYFRIFNPVTQSARFDPSGSYIRRWVPELAALSGLDVHEPWRRAGGPPQDYPIRIVDHAEQRAEALAAYEALRPGRRR